MSDRLEPGGAAPDEPGTIERAQNNGKATGHVAKLRRELGPGDAAVDG